MVDVGALDPAVLLPRLVLPQTVEAELVLDADDVDIGAADRTGRGHVTVRRALTDPPPHLRPVCTHGVALIDRCHLDDGVLVRRQHRGHEVGGERGDATAPRRVGGDEGDAHAVSVGAWGLLLARSARSRR